MGKIKKLANKTVVTKEIDIALIGNPNAGKTTVFNALTGMRHKVGNYPGVTVEKKAGFLKNTDGLTARVYDLPGLYSLVPKSLDDKIASDIVTGRSKELVNLKLIIVVADASNLSRNLYLVTQTAELGFPVILALNMVDAAQKNGLQIDVNILSKQLGIPVIPIIANKGQGIPKLRDKIFELISENEFQIANLGLEITGETEDAIKPIQDWLLQNTDIHPATSKSEALRVVSNNKALENWHRPVNGKPGQKFAEFENIVQQARNVLASKNLIWSMLETNLRYQWVDAIYHSSVKETKQDKYSISEKFDRVLTHKILGPIIFLLIFGAIFQSIFAWAEIPMNAIENFMAWLGVQVTAVMPDGVLEDLIVDGAIAGVGAILVFLPQILFLFFFLSLLEDTGYLARAAFIMDRFMRGFGLSGRSVFPLLSSFACAIPGIMATRTIRNSRDRLITIMIAPLMSCSARLPVYALMIGAFIPKILILGIFTLPGLILLSMYLLGILAAMGAAVVLKKFSIKDHKPSTFMMELPPYRRPSIRWTFLQMAERAKIFVTDAGKIILAISIVLWFLAYYPKPDIEMSSSQAIKQSYAGRLGHIIEPAIRPLGFDWKMGIGLITSFAAREVLVSTLATIYNVEGEAEGSGTLRQALKNDRDRETGKPVHTPLTAISLMVFFVLACQCMSTVAVVKRETNSWFWPITMIVYMTALAYIGSFLVFQGGKLLGLG